MTWNLRGIAKDDHGQGTEGTIEQLNRVVVAYEKARMPLAIIAVQETHLIGDQTPPDLNHFKWFGRNRTRVSDEISVNARGSGGVGFWVHESISRFARVYMKPTWGGSEGVLMLKISCAGWNHVFVNTYLEFDRPGFKVELRQVIEGIDSELDAIRDRGWLAFVLGDLNLHTADLKEHEDAPARRSVDKRPVCALARPMLEAFASNDMLIVHGRLDDEPRATYDGLGTESKESVIDYVVIPECMYTRVKSAGVDTVSDCDSDHNPLYVQMNWSYVSHANRSKKPESNERKKKGKERFIVKNLASDAELSAYRIAASTAFRNFRNRHVFSLENARKFMQSARHRDEYFRDFSETLRDVARSTLGSRTSGGHNTTNGSAKPWVGTGDGVIPTAWKVRDGLKKKFELARQKHGASSQHAAEARIRFLDARKAAVKLVRRAQRKNRDGKLDAVTVAFESGDPRAHAMCREAAGMRHRKGAIASPDLVVGGRTIDDPQEKAEAHAGRLAGVVSGKPPEGSKWDPEARKKADAQSVCNTAAARAETTESLGRYIAECLEQEGQCELGGPATTLHTHAEEIASSHIEIPEEAAPSLDCKRDQERLNNPISIVEMATRLRQMKHNRAPGDDGINAELLQNAGVEALVALCELLNTCLACGKVPSEFGHALVSMIPKPEGDTSDPSAYRPISLLGRVGMLLEAVLNFRLSEYADAWGIEGPMPAHCVLPDQQGGSRPGRRTIDLSMTLSETIKFRARRRQKTFSAFLDIKGAFDSLYVPCMLNSARSAGIRGRFLALLANSYEHVTSTVNVGGAQSAKFACPNGLRQGAVLSPIVWAIFLTPLVNAINAAGLGVTLVSSKTGEKVTVSGLAYVDDIALVAPTPVKLQSALNIAARLVNELQLTFSAKKCKVIAFGAPTNLRAAEWTLNGLEIEQVNSYKYLGIRFDRQLGCPSELQDKADAFKTSITTEHAPVDALDASLAGRRFIEDGLEQECTLVEHRQLEDKDGKEYGPFYCMAWYSTVADLEDPEIIDLEPKYYLAHDMLIAIEGEMSPWGRHFNDVYPKARTGLGTVRRLGGVNKSYSAGIARTLLNTFCVSKMSTDQAVYANDPATKLENVYTQGLKRILGVSLKTHNHACREMLGVTSLKIQREKALLLQFKHIADMPEDRLVRKVWGIVATDPTPAHSRHIASCPKIAKSIARKWGVWDSICEDSPAVYKRSVSTAALAAEAESFKDRDTAHKLDIFRRYPRNTSGYPAPYLCNRLPLHAASGRDIATRHLLGTHDLSIDKLRGKVKNPLKRYCTIESCMAKSPRVENALHFALECPARETAVDNFRLKIRELREDILADGSRISAANPLTTHQILMDPHRECDRLSYEWFRHLRTSHDQRASQLPKPQRRIATRQPTSPEREGSCRTARQDQEAGPDDPGAQPDPHDWAVTDPNPSPTARTEGIPSPICAELLFP